MVVGPTSNHHCLIASCWILTSADRVVFFSPVQDYSIPEQSSHLHPGLYGWFAGFVDPCGGGSTRWGWRGRGRGSRNRRSRRDHTGSRDILLNVFFFNKIEYTSLKIYINISLESLGSVNMADTWKIRDECAVKDSQSILSNTVLDVGDFIVFCETQWRHRKPF